MSIKSILVPLGNFEGCDASLSLALNVGRRVGARVTAMHVALDPNATIPYVGEGMTGAMIDDLITSMEREAAAQEAQAKAQFERTCAEQGISPATAPKGAGFAARFAAAVGREADLVAERGRVADLVVLPAPGNDDFAEAPTLQAAIMETGCPVLLAPREAPATFGQRIAIAWNGSVQAARALGTSLDLLTQAEKVVVLTVDEGGRAGPPVEDAVDYLDTHGIAAEARTLASTGMPVAETLLVEVGALAADLLVMGAYTHSRVREMILGGVTRDMLFELNLPVMMTH